MTIILLFQTKCCVSYPTLHAPQPWPTHQSFPAATTLFAVAAAVRLVVAVRCLHTVQHHSDYVTCLAASEAAGKLVSAGLRSEVITYDMQVGPHMTAVEGITALQQPRPAAAVWYALANITSPATDRQRTLTCAAGAMIFSSKVVE